MEPTDDLQQLEITALQSIYGEDYLESPPPKAWRAATRLPEFIIKVSHPEQRYASKVYFHLHTKFPRTYPSLACPTFNIQEPTQGLNNDQISKLSNAIHDEALKNRGTEMVFQIVNFSQEWLIQHVIPPSEAPGSLATQMTQRTQDEEEARRQREAVEALEEQERAARLAEQLSKQIRADAQRQQLAREQQYKARKRAESNATEVPSSGDTPVETFDKEIEMNGICFQTVKIFHPRKECLGTIYSADPVCDDINVTLPLELYVVVFDTHHYTTHSGKKKLQQLESEVQRLTTIRHPNVLRVLAVKLTIEGSATLSILSEQSPSLTLQDIMDDCDTLREERAIKYMIQILSALQAIHSSDLVHRGFNTRCVGLERALGSREKLIKIGKVGYHVMLLDMYKSNPFGYNAPGEKDVIPEAWQFNISASPLSYPRSRDIFHLGIIFLQMLCGGDVMVQFGDLNSALRASSISSQLQHCILNFFIPSKKYTCATLLRDLKYLAVHDLSGSATRRPSIPVAGPNIPTPHNYHSSPEIDYIVPAHNVRESSRWKEDWEELELLGRGAFGSVVKARNKIDGRIYAVKKVRLQTRQSNKKIFREVNALSSLSHPYIVRYFTTWVETSRPVYAPNSTDFDSDTSDGMTSVPHSLSTGKIGHSNSRSNGYTTSISTSDLMSFNLDDLVLPDPVNKTFPDIHFARSRSGSGTDESDESSDLETNSLLTTGGALERRPVTPPPPDIRTLYIQMEFVERQTLKERVDEGLMETEAWRLFQQILEALVHMATLGILHRDIKLTNIFIDGKGNCKVGDFGLATTDSVTLYDTLELSPSSSSSDDMTRDVGTKLYIAPEVQSRKKLRYESKADIYSLGIVFFEMNYHFTTGSERIAVVEDLRKPEIFFPPTWPSHLEKQKEIITWLLQHDPANRPTPFELSQSPLLPSKFEDEYFKSALDMMSKGDSPHRQVVINALFSQPPTATRGYLYDAEADLPEHAALFDVVQARLAAIFCLHGAVDMEPPLLMPLMKTGNEEEQALFLDRYGDLVALPDNALDPFARLAARGNMKRIKRYHITNVYKPHLVAGHPKFHKSAVFDIITPDITSGPIAAAAELLTIVNDCLGAFPTLSQTYEVHISHSKIVEVALNRVPPDLRSAVADIMNQSRNANPGKRVLLLKKGLLRSTADELEILSETDPDVDGLVAKLEKSSPAFLQFIGSAIDEIKQTIQYAKCAGFTAPIIFRPFMCGPHHTYFKEGVCFEVVKKNRRQDILATGGRYDSLIVQYTPPKKKQEVVCAFAVQIVLEKITQALASYQNLSVKALVRDEKSFGFWSPRRCDVYVVSYHAGYLQDRLEVAALLWQNNISADIMYESGLPDSEHQNYLESCAREGILFTVYPRPRTLKREQLAFKVKSVLKGTEYEVSRQELVSWLSHQIAEQKRIDASTSGGSSIAEHTTFLPNTVLMLSPNKAAASASRVSTKEIHISTHASRGNANSPDVQLILPTDAKRTRRQVKTMFTDRAHDLASSVRQSILGGLPTLAIDVPPFVFTILTQTEPPPSTWLANEDAWRILTASFPEKWREPGRLAYAAQVREAIARRKADGLRWVLLVALRQGRLSLMDLSERAIH